MRTGRKPKQSLAEPAPQSERLAAASDFRAKIRMYRHGLGDCFLIRLPRLSGTASGPECYSILIDCGVILGTPNAATKMGQVVQDVISATGGTVDLLPATHEHWDHLSGFVQAKDELTKLKVREVWLAWTEDPTDDMAKALGGERNQALATLRATANQLHLSGAPEAVDELFGLVEFFGAGAGATTKDALEVVRGLTERPIYCRPDQPPRMIVEAGGIRLYVLGPPREERLIRKTLPSARDPETYALVPRLYLEQVGPALRNQAEAKPFSTLYAIPMNVAEQIDFFKAHYSGAEEWRRIDSTWLADATELALQLDSLTNNTSLVVAIELPDNDVLLFAADAQVGNWESWQRLEWTVDGRKVTGPDLLRRTVFYKVGHHGSHNATLRENGLELMHRLRTAMIPVDHAMAVKKRWGKMPLPELVDALTKQTSANSGFVLRTDDPTMPGEAAGRVESKELYYELTL